MKHPFYKSLVAASALALIGTFAACSDDGGDSIQIPNQPTSSESSYTGPVIPGYTGNVVYIINLDDVNFIVSPLDETGSSQVWDSAGNLVGVFDGAAIYNGEGVKVLDVNESMLNEVVYNPSISIPESSAEVEIPESSVSGAIPGVESSGSVPGIESSGSVIPGELPVESSSAVVIPGVESSADVEIPVSSSSEVVKPSLENGFPPIESYGEPPAEYTKDILNNGKTGWNSRYWDACKPHCSWLSSVDTTSEEAYQAGMTVARNCNIHDVEVPAFTLAQAVQQYWMGYEGTNSACKTGASGTFACTDMAPIAVNENLSYGYVAGSGSQYKYGCGKCYHLQYNGGKNDGDVKATHKALKGKHIVVMVSNIGYDVEVGQFDLMIPGGGVGAFDALSTQLGVPTSALGANGGGIGRVCFEQEGWDAPVEKFQACINKKCEEVFAGWPNLLRGCKWYADWYMAADNPTYNWEEVDCPQYLVDHYMTTINTEKNNRYRWKDDWSDYKTGDEIKTQDCLTAEYPEGCAP